MHRKEMVMAAAKKETTKKAAEKKPVEKKQTVKKDEFETFKAKVVYGSLNVRKDPEIKEGNIIKSLPVDTVVTIIGQKDDWYKIKEGWIMSKYTDRVEK